MHDYSIDKHPKEKIIFAISFIAIWMTPKIQGFVQSYIDKLNPSDLMFAIPITFIFAGLYILFDNFVWKCRKLRKLFLVPDINGTWLCNGKTLYKDGEPVTFDWQGVIVINQSWSKLSIIFKGSQSESKSITASIYHDKGVGYRVYYQYKNSPQIGEEELLSHIGSTELLFDEDCENAEGCYFTDHSRMSAGKISLVKVK